MSDRYEIKLAPSRDGRHVCWEVVDHKADPYDPYYNGYGGTARTVEKALRKANKIYRKLVDRDERIQQRRQEILESNGWYER